MKFGKEFSSQMVPEWEKAYVQYDYLKTLLKDIQRFKQRTRPPATPGGLKRDLALYRAFSGLTQWQRHNPVSPSSASDIESQTILVNSVSKNGGHSYETTFRMSADDGGEYELVYFRRLDDEFNKVDKFYKSKVQELLKEAATLNTQMDALIAFRIKVENPPASFFDRTVEMTRLASDIAASAAELSISTPAGARASRRQAHMDVIEETGESSHGQSDESIDDKDKIKEKNNMKKKVHEEQKKPVEVKAPRPRPRPAPLEILEKTEIKFNRENLRKVEDQLKQAFVEFYRKLRLVKSYCFLNTLAFSKIMKKYDKITLRNASNSYMKMVDNSYLGSSEEVFKLMERVEATFIKHFSNSNRSKGMNILRPKAKRERHGTTFSTGLFAGCTAALIIALIFIIRTHDILHKQGQKQYMDKHVSSLQLVCVYCPAHAHVCCQYILLEAVPSQLFLHIWFQARNRDGLSTSSTCGFWYIGTCAIDCDWQPGYGDRPPIKRLPWIDRISAFDLGFGSACCIVVSIQHLLSLKSLLLLSMFIPLYCCSSLQGKVTLPDFFLADQFTSQVQALRNLEFYICYYGWGDVRHRTNYCSKSTVFNTFNFIVAVIPYMSRFLQCLRRLFEEKDPMHGYNGIKYFLTIVAVCMRTALNLDGGKGWEVLAWTFSVLAAIFCTYWDLVLDWGLLNRHSKNRWLRDKLLVSKKSVYFIAMLLNVLLRFAWIQTVVKFDFDFMHRNTLIAIVACLEIIRRGIWNFFRLENEHLNNVGKYRAFKSVPLPFNHDEDEDKDL
ncbi:hypothetical protein Patl1_16793 [Pistacia atlantica]|uniref:Uncharacterized protein n=1 Tax=Pistacia atlantica TaxID=434234 RepID=A0ACC1B8W8_9ROSI|nr:hypothetical protein Patl1_16793 [Pistacia atlantica]